MQVKFDWIIIYIIITYSSLVWALCAWMFLEHARRRFQKRNSGSLAVAKYVFSIVWHETVVRIVTVSCIWVLTVALLFTPPASSVIPSIHYSIVRLIATMTLLTTIAIMSILDNPHFRRANDTLEEAYEKEIIEGVKKVILK